MKKPTSPAEPDQAKPHPTGDAAAAIGSRLRSVYDDVLSEPVPAHLTDLIARLKKSG